MSYLKLPKNLNNEFAPREINVTEFASYMMNKSENRNFSGDYYQEIEDWANNQLGISERNEASSFVASMVNSIVQASGMRELALERYGLKVV